ncbi:MAG: aminopeptidase P family protein [Clostridia bacterium]|nr:aminopeptidase P family protein [Clostridia bacterium]
MLAPNLRKIYENSHADALLIEQDFLRRYLTGFYSTDGYVVLTAEKCVLVVDSRYIEAAQKAKLADCVEVVEGSYSAALELVKGHKNLGVPYPFINLARAEELKKEGFSLSDCMDALKNAMLIKTERELKQIARACEIAEDAFLRLLPQIKERMCEREVAALLEYEMRALGAEGVSFDTIAAFGANGSVPHHETGETRLRFGDAVLIDFGCKTEGYCSDCTRTFLFGDDKKHEKFKEIYAHVLAAHERVIERVAAGMTGQEADAIARGYLKEQGLDKYFTHSLGHGIGLQIHEYPVLSPRREDVLQDGMVFSDEPGVYIAGEIGVRIEDSLYMKDGKAHSFMKKTQKNLIIL